MIFMHIDNGKLLMSAYDTLASAKEDIKGAFYKLPTGNYISQEFFDTVLKPDDMKQHSIPYIDADTYYIYVHKHICDNCKHRMACMLDGYFNDKDDAIRKCSVKSLRMKAKGTKMKHAQAEVTLDEAPITHKSTHELNIQMYDYAKALATVYNAPNRAERLYVDIITVLDAQTDYLNKVNGVLDERYFRARRLLLPIVAIRPVLLHTVNDKGMPLLVCSQAIVLKDYTIL